jgi:Cys-rich protein (TIGR01571 family)
MSYVKEQPQNVQAMHVAGHRNVKNLPVGKNGRAWSHSLLGCFGACGTCLCACLCPCMVYNKNKHRVQHLNSKGTPLSSPSGCGCDCLLHGCLLGLGFAWILQMSSRSTTRERYNIEGGCCGDCCAACFCGPCELVQASREIELEENSFGRY